MADVQQILNDPNFKGLPLPEKNKVLMKVDPNFAGLPGPERMKVLSSIQYGKPLPSPTPPPTLKSGLQAVGRGIADPFEGIGEVVTEGIPSLVKQTVEAAQKPPQTTSERIATAFGPEALVGYRMLYEPQKELAEKAKGSKGLQKAGYTAAAALPVAGPFAASIGESIQKPTDIAKAGGRALAWTEIPKAYARELPRPVAEHLKLGLKDVDEGLGTSAGKAGRKAAAMTKDIRVAAPDLVAAADEVDPKLKGAEKLHDLAEKVAARKEEVWQKGHEPGFRAFGTREVDMASVKRAAGRQLSKVGDWVNQPEANSARAWISGLPDRMTLNQLDDFVRELNADLVNKDPRDAAGYGPKGIQARLNAVEEARNVIDRKLEEAGMPGVKEYNKRYGALKKIEDQLQVRAVQLARKEARNNLDVLPRWAHIYSFWHGHGIPFLGLGIRGAGLFERTPADTLFRGIDRLRKSGIQPTPFPATPPLPNIRGLLGEGPKIMPAVPDTSYVRGIPAEYPAKESR